MVSKLPKTAYRQFYPLELFVSALLFACSAKPDLPSMAGGSLLRPSDLTDGGTSLHSCLEGSTQPCSKTLARQGNVLSCYYGTQTCVGGQWSDCADGAVVQQTASSTAGNGERLASISSSQPCDDNRCDPSCQRYVEVPSMGLTAQASNVTWRTGTVSSLPNSEQGAVSKPNCAVAADCQQNQHCINVATNAACAHDKCETGQGLSTSCNDACVNEICAQNSSCCDSQKPCADGQLRSPDGTRCYYYNSTQLNQADAARSCASIGNGWDLACISAPEVENLLSQATENYAWLGLERITPDNPTSAFKCRNGGQPLQNGSTQGVWPWNWGEPNYYQGNYENCVEMFVGGAWNDENCGDTLASWCEGPSRTPGTWTSACVNSVASVCGASCDTTGMNPPAACQGWATGETNPNDQGADLGIGVPCQGQIPVCNHGTAVAPAGAIVHVFPTSNPFGTQNLAAQLGTCSTASSIAPGACVMVSGCSNLLVNNVELFVTYPTGSGTEARTDDNWGYGAPGGTCGPPQCLAGLGPCFASVTKTFDYEGLCPQSDQVPQWSYLTFTSSTPGDSSIHFSVAAAANGDQLSTEPSVPVITASHAAGNEQCDFFHTGLVNCPADLYKALTPSVTTHGAVLRLTITLDPSSDGLQSPSLTEWKISYSCVAGT